MKIDKDNIKKVFLFLSVIPYAFFMVLGIINCISTSIEFKNLDLYSLMEPILDFWINNITTSNLWGIGLSIFCIVYPIYYYIDNCDKKHRSNNKIIFSKSFIFYLISFIPYLFIAYFCIFGLDYSFITSSDIAYGFEALIVIGILNFIFPIIPILLIFQFIYTIKKYNDFNQKTKKLILGIILSLLLLIIIPCVVYGI